MYDIFRGLRVVEVAEWVFVPTAAAILADWGADVVKIEHPTRGDSIRGLFSKMNSPGSLSPAERPLLELSNRGKRSMAFDLNTEGGKDVLYRLLDTADVFLTNFLPATQEKLGITPADVHRRNPRIVYGMGTACGSRGLRAGRPGFDLTQTWCAGGLAYQMTPPGASEPANMPSSVGDLTSALALAGGVAAALYERERGGDGKTVEVSLYSIGMWLMSQWISAGAVGAAQPPGLKRSDAANPLMAPYQTMDGRWLWLSFLQPDRWWPDLCRHIERTDLIDDPRFSTLDARAANRALCMSELEDAFRRKNLNEWMSILDTLEGSWAPVASPEEIAVDPQVEANGYFPTASGGSGDIAVVSSPMQFDGQPVGDLRTMSEFGADTEDVLLELGNSWDDIGDQVRDGVLP
jgi:crotonobetainyl-CoA:carnitine CoA-transferase CaiB-like acyl-CoA transferase